MPRWKFCPSQRRMLECPLHGIRRIRHGLRWGKPLARAKVANRHPTAGLHLRDDNPSVATMPGGESTYASCPAMPTRLTSSRAISVSASIARPFTGISTSPIPLTGCAIWLNKALSAHWLPTITHSWALCATAPWSPSKPDPRLPSVSEMRESTWFSSHQLDHCALTP